MRISIEKFILITIFISTFLISIDCEDVKWTGTSPKVVEQYSNKDHFVCDQGRKIEIKNVNDDYCDCKDGTDEPGTSACSNRLLYTVTNDEAPSEGFYCANKGYKAKYIPTSFVNDGICDCCDGTDEFEKRVECENVCKKAGEQEFLKIVEEIKLHEKGAELKIELIKEAQAIKPTISQDAENLRSQLEFARAELSEAEKKEAHARELATEAEAFIDDDSEDFIREDEEVDDEEKRLRRADPTRATLQLEFEEKHGVLPSQAVTNHKQAKADTRAARRKVDDLQEQLNKSESASGLDFGPDDVFLALKGKSISTNYGGYNYVLKPFVTVEQSGTPLGEWEGWEGGHSIMKFTRGRKCWGAGERQATVTVKCGLETILTDVYEPSTCIYTMVLETPAACSLDHANFLREQLKELGHSDEEIDENRARFGGHHNKNGSWFGVF